MSISPISATVASGATQQFTAAVTNWNSSVTWSVDGHAGGSSTSGTITTSGLYTAPAVTASATHSVTATSVADPTKSATATVTVTAPNAAAVTVTITPTTALIQSKYAQQFTSKVTNASNTAVTWSVDGVTGGSSAAGTITTVGLYTAPAVTASTNHTVRATSVADATKAASATVTVSPTPVPVTVSVSPSSANVGAGAQQQFTAGVSGTSNTGVTWWVNGTQGGNSTVGTITSAGLYTAPRTVPSGAITVTATSSYDSTASGSATVTIQAATTVSISPTSASVTLQKTQQFTASVSGASNTGVTWSVSGVQGGNSTVGTISTSGLYTAPAAVPASSPVVKATSVADTTKTASATISLVAPATNATGAFAYGSGLNSDELANTQVGGTDCGCSNARSAFRFRAATSSTLPSIRVYFEDGSGYSGGNGGTIRVELQTDDGSSAHLPSGSVLASTNISPGNPASNRWPQLNFTSTPQLTAGQLYHIVFTNVDNSPTSNFMSVNALYMDTSITPQQPKFADTDYAQLLDTGRGWSVRPSFTPVLQLNYGNGVVAGVGYMEVWVSNPKSISGSSSVRELFTVSGANQQVSGVAVRVARSSGSDPLTLRLEDGSGNAIEQVTVAASSIGSSMTWARANFSTTRTLNAGTTYHLVLSAPSSSTYTTFPIRDGSDEGFTNGAVFADGYAQVTTGSGWAGWDMWGSSNRTDGDLQFYFFH